MKPHRYDGRGGYAPNSSRIPFRAWIGTVAAAAACWATWAAVMMIVKG